MEGKRGRVLIIEDDELLSRAMRRALEPDHDVVVLTSAKEALDLITTGARYDLVLCDLMLPGVSGADFHERLGQVAPEMVERTIFTTGGAHTPRTEAFLLRPDVRHMNKPFPPLAEFRAMVQEHLLRLGGSGR